MQDTRNFWTVLKPRISVSHRQVRFWAEMGCGSQFVAKRLQAALGCGRVEKGRARVLFSGEALRAALAALHAPDSIRVGLEALLALTGVQGGHTERYVKANELLDLWDAELAEFDDYLGGRA